MLIDIYEHMNIYIESKGGCYANGEAADQRAEGDETQARCLAKGGNVGQWLYSEPTGEGIQTSRGAPIIEPVCSMQVYWRECLEGGGHDN